jgi:hypothetical protein
MAQLAMPLVTWMLPASRKKYKEIQAADLAKAMVNASKSSPKGIHFFEYPEIMKQLGR